MALAHQVEQAARGGDQHIDAAAHGVDLAALADAAEHHGVADAQMAAIGGEAGVDLRGEFAGGCQHEHAGAARRRGDAALGQPMQDRQREGGGFAGAGLRQTEQVAPAEQMRDRLGLNRGWCGVALFSEGAQQRFGKRKGGEIGHAKGASWRQGSGLKYPPAGARKIG